MDSFTSSLVPGCIPGRDGFLHILSSSRLYSGRDGYLHVTSGSRLYSRWGWISTCHLWFQVVFQVGMDLITSSLVPGCFPGWDGYLHVISGSGCILGRGGFNHFQYSSRLYSRWLLL